MPEELENVQDPQDELTLTEIIEQNNEAMQAIIDELETRENVSLETTTITPSTSRQTITPTKYGFSEVTVEAVDSSIDQNIEPSNIRRGVTILGVLGDCDPDKPDQTKTATPTTSQQVITADTGFELASVTIEPVNPSDYYKTEETATVTPSINQQTVLPQNPNNVLSEVTINPAPLGTITVTPSTTSQSVTPSGNDIGFHTVYVDAVPLENYTVTPSTQEQVIQPSSNALGLAYVIVNPAPLSSTTVTPTTSQQIITPSPNTVGLSTVIVNAVPLETAQTVTPSTQEQVITPTGGNIGLSSVTVNPVSLESKIITPTTSQQVITPTAGTTSLGLSQVTINAVTSSIDNNIVSWNIKAGVSILGIDGSVIEYNPTRNETVTPSNVQQTITNNSANQLNTVTIDAVGLETANVTPTTSAQTLTPSGTNVGFSQINVSAVTSSVDANITAGNILDGITILGVTGTAIEQASGMASAVETLETLTSSLESEIARIFDDITQSGNTLQINTTGASVTQDGTEVTID